MAATTGNEIIGGIVEDKGADGRNVNQWHWTEKDITAWAKQHTTDLLANQVLVDEPALRIALTDIRNFGGEVTLNVRKKKLIPLYEVNFAVGWEGQELNPEDGSVTFSAEGQIEVPYLSEENHDEDPEIRTTCTQAGSQAEALRQTLLKRCKATVLEKVAQLVTDIRAGGPERPSAKQGAGSGAGGGAGAVGSTAQAAGEFKKQAAEAAKPATVVSKPPTTSSSNSSRTNIRIDESFRTTPKELYACFTEMSRIIAYTQAPAVVEPVVGGTLSLYSGAVQCTYTALEPHTRIELDWRFTTWPEGVVSKVVMDFEARDAGETVLHITQTGIPEEDKYGNEDVLSNVQLGWRQQILFRIKAVFGFGV